MALTPEAIESSAACATLARRRPRVRALMAILVLCALVASSAAAVLVPADVSATSRATYMMSEREYREAAKSAAKSGASHRGTAPGEKVTIDPC